MVAEMACRIRVSNLRWQCICCYESKLSDEKARFEKDLADEKDKFEKALAYQKYKFDKELASVNEKATTKQNTIVQNRALH